MSEKMTPMKLTQLLDIITNEYEKSKSVFGVRSAYRKKDGKTLPIFSEKLETPIGPAAGPHTQLAQNIISAYFAGARFFELKTVQTLDGEDLAKCISRPCIKADDEGYNCEWSTELTVQQAFDEYVKAWCVIKYIARKYALGDKDGFVFNMSVGYDLDGIKSEKIDRFIEGLKDASDTDIFKECIDTLCHYFPDDCDYICAISPHICTSVTLSTLHGCPPDEIERIATYLISEKKLNTFVKCNPTLLGYETARGILDSMGYDYIAFDEHHFNEDLQYGDAVEMFKRLSVLAKENNLEFGLKLSNTFPVDVKAKELPSDEMYMSGKALFALTVEMANRISREFSGKMRISYSGGADYFNIDKLFECSIWPITVATTLLKPGGYSRLNELAKKLEDMSFEPFVKVDCGKVARLSENCRTDIHHTKPIKPQQSRKIGEEVPLVDCFTAPCSHGCPINQDIPQYIELCKKGMYSEALEVITAKNPLPFITGTICAHRCMTKCTRNFYESPVKIRDTKLLAAENGYDELMKNTRDLTDENCNKKVAVIGGGVCGLSASYFAAKKGIPVTVFERDEKIGGVVKNIIPDFRISYEAIEKDIDFIKKTGVKIVAGKEAPSVKELKDMGFTHILFAVGAHKSSVTELSGNVMNAMDFLCNYKRGTLMNIGENIAVVGGGNTAMDAARAAKRVSTVKNVSIVYRRTRRYMPADEEELTLALSEGVDFYELLSPVEQKDGRLYCRKMKLAQPDEKGRRSVEMTEETAEISADTVILATGEKVDTDIFVKNSVATDENGKVPFKTNIDGVYNAGDSLRGPSTVVECIADAMNFVKEITGEDFCADIPKEAYSDEQSCFDKRAVLCDRAKCEGDRCLECSTVCTSCADVCPNRANAVIRLKDGRIQIIHLDALCNECGNCKSFCPYDSAPYKDKFTLFKSVEDFDNSTNMGFVVLDESTVRMRIVDVKDIKISECIDSDNDILKLIGALIGDYSYLF